MPQNMYNFWDVIIQCFGFVIAAVSLLIAWIQTRKANRIAEEANARSKRANKTAIEANELSAKANEIAKEANELAEKAFVKADRPVLKLDSVQLIPSQVEIYGGSQVHLPGKKDFLNGHMGIIGKTYRSDSMQYILNKTKKTDRYFLVNLCSEETEEENILLVLSALNIKVKCTEGSINKARTLKLFSMKSKNETFPTNMDVDIENVFTNNELSICVAYVCTHGEVASLKLDNIANIAAKKSPPIDLLNNTSEEYSAGDIIGFYETAYLYECQSESGRSYEYTLYMKPEKKDLFGYVISGSTEFYNKVEEANKRERNKTEVITVSKKNE